MTSSMCTGLYPSQRGDQKTPNSNKDTGRPTLRPPGVLMDALTPLHDGGDLLITAFPGSGWIREVGVDGNPIANDMDIIGELLTAVEETQNLSLDGRMDWIDQQLMQLEKYQDQTAFYNYPMIHENGSVLRTVGIKDALHQFEEDLEFENWISSKEYQQSLKEFNMHKLFAATTSDRSDLVWVGESTTGRSHTLTYPPEMGDRKCEIEETFIKCRYETDVEIVTHYGNQGGYSKGTTPFGDVWIPSKIKYLPPIGHTSKMTIALQDVGDKNRNANSFRWTAIYQHK